MLDIANLDRRDPEDDNITEFGFLFLRNLNKIFKESSLEEKYTVLGLMFPKKMIFNGKSFQTEFEDDIISLLYKPGAGFKRKRERQKKNFDCLSQEVSRAGFKPTTTCLEGRSSIQLSYRLVILPASPPHWPKRLQI